MGKAKKSKRRRRRGPVAVLTDREMVRHLKRLRTHRQRLLRRAGVERVDVGYRWVDGRMTSEICLRAYVSKKVDLAKLPRAERIPRSIFGIPVDVIESSIDLHEGERFDPIVGGSQARNVRLDQKGTIGAVVIDRATGDSLVLSNHHVFVRSRANGARGDWVTQPGTTAVGDRIARVLRSNRELDCAVAQLGNQREASRGIVGIPGGVTGVVPPAIGMRVIKSGAKTGRTEGVIDGVGTHELSIVPASSGGELTKKGDSGALWLEASSHAAVGLHFAGEKPGQREQASAKHMTKVAETLKIRLTERVGLRTGSRASPALAARPGELLLVWSDRVTGRIRCRASTDGRTFGTIRRLGAATRLAPAAVSFGGSYVVAYASHGTRELRVISSTDGTAWGPDASLNARTASPPTLAASPNRVFCAWRARGSNRISMIESTDSRTWSAKTTLPWTTRTGPALAALGNRLVLVWGDAADRLWTSTRTGGAFSPKKAIGRKSDAPVALTAGPTGLFLAWRDAESARIHLATSDDGSSWTDRVALREESKQSPCLVHFGERLWIGWTARGDASIELLAHEVT